jgi:benzodiazapine receptor
MPESKFKSAIALVLCFAVAFVAAAIGSVASIRAAEFYKELSRPSWAPPANLFGPVWTFLYCCMGIASWLVWRENSGHRTKALAVYLVQLALNALWSWLFFAWREGRWAFVEVVVLWAAILLTIVLFWRVRRIAAVLLVPYFLWVSFAACLTYAVWKLNPGLLS